MHVDAELVVSAAVETVVGAVVIPAKEELALGLPVGSLAQPAQLQAREYWCLVRLKSVLSGD